MIEITRQSGKKRRGKLHTRNGILETPFFMPDATRAAVRGVGPAELTKTGIEALVVNTYHLTLQPGTELIEKSGGIHKFMQWAGPILSDSGGYQVYSLIHKNSAMGCITEEGAQFKSVYDGSTHLLTPEVAIQNQFALGVDMMVCLDDPRPNDVGDEEIVAAVDRTLRWAARCKDEYTKQVAERGLTPVTRPLLFAVVQGGMNSGERKRCAEGLVAIGFDGYGFGGRHIDSEGNFLEDVIRETAACIPKSSPRFALGIGTPEDIVRCFQYGWDMFDCVIPTREGRHGRLFVWRDGSLRDGQSFYETINIHNEQFREDFTPVDGACACPLCTHHTKAYLRHLFRVGDPLAGRLASLHNLAFYSALMQKLREE